MKNPLRKLLTNQRGDVPSSKIVAVVGLVVVFIMWLYITPIVAHEIDYIIFHNASTWNFTAHEGAEAILGLSGFIWIIGGVLLLVGGVFSIMKWGA